MNTVPASWLKYKLNNAEYGQFNHSDITDLKSYSIKIPKPSRLNESYSDEFYKTIKLLPVNTKYYILFSGGYDSAITLYSFVKCKIPFIPVITRFYFNGELINEPELKYARIDLQRLSLEAYYIDIDVTSFLEQEKYKFWYNIFPNWHIERFLQMEMIYLAPRDGVIIVSAGDPNLILENGNWHWVDRSCALHHFFQSQYLKLQIIPHFLSCTNELGASFLLNQELVSLVNKKSHMSFDFGLKYNLYPIWFPEVPYREKIITTNKFKNNYYNKLIEQSNFWLRKNSKSFGLEIKIPYSDLIQMKWEKDYKC